MPAQKRPFEIHQQPDTETDPSQSSSDHDHDDAEDNDKEKPEYVVVRLSEVRKEVQCPICLGVIRKTRTVMECLHRFCRECIDKSMRLGNNECPACRTHCASRRSLRDDPNFDALIAALYPDIDKYEEEELALCEEEKAHNKQVQDTIAQTFRRQAEALSRKKTTAKVTARAFARRTEDHDQDVNSKAGRNYRIAEGSDESNDANREGSNDSSSADEQSEELNPKRCKRQVVVSRESLRASTGLIGTPEAEMIEQRDEEVLEQPIDEGRVDPNQMGEALDNNVLEQQSMEPRAEPTPEHAQAQLEEGGNTVFDQQQPSPPPSPHREILTKVEHLSPRRPEIDLDSFIARPTPSPILLLGWVPHSQTEIGQSSQAAAIQNDPGHTSNPPTTPARQVISTSLPPNDSADEINLSEFMTACNNNFEAVQGWFELLNRRLQNQRQSSKEQFAELRQTVYDQNRQRSAKQTEEIRALTMIREHLATLTAQNASLLTAQAKMEQSILAFKDSTEAQLQALRAEQQQLIQTVKELKEALCLKLVASEQTPIRLPRPFSIAPPDEDPDNDF